MKNTHQIIIYVLLAVLIGAVGFLYYKSRENFITMAHGGCVKGFVDPTTAVIGKVDNTKLTEKFQGKTPKPVWTGLQRQCQDISIFDNPQ